VAEVESLLGLTVSARSAETWTEAIGRAYEPATPAPTDPGPAVDTVFVEKVLTRQFPAARQVLDWYHLQEHLATVAAELPEGATWHEAQRDALAARGPRETFRALARVARHGATPTAREAARKCFGYMARHRHRFDYPAARAAGYPIGSGRIESGCKQVVTVRCKGPGMRWHHPHAQDVLWARCALLNGEWECAVEQARLKAA
jgi:hypothetical protein